MTDKTEAYATMAIGVEALEEVGLNVENADVQEIGTGPLGALFGMDQSQTKVVFVCDVTEAPENEHGDDGDRESPEEIDFDEQAATDIPFGNE